MIIHLEKLNCNWDIQKPYYEWTESGTGLVGKGLTIPDGIPNPTLHIGHASVTIEVSFAVTGDPTDKQDVFKAKILELLKEIKL